MAAPFVATSTMLPIFAKLSTSSKHANNTEDDLHCPICFEPFTDTLQSPICAKGCRHSICRICLSRLDTYRRNTTGGREVRARRPVTLSQGQPGTPFSNVSSFSFGPPATTNNTNKKYEFPCPVCRQGVFTRDQEAHNLTICLLMKINAMKSARSHRIMRGSKFLKDPLLKLREKNLLANARTTSTAEVDFYKDRVRTLEAENVALLAENAELFAGEQTKQSITEGLLRDSEKCLADLKTEFETAKKRYRSKHSITQATINRLKTEVELKQEAITASDTKTEELLHKLWARTATLKEYENALAKAQREKAKAVKTERLLVFALFVMVTFSCLALFFALAMMRQPTSCLGVCR